MSAIYRSYEVLVEETASNHKTRGERISLTPRLYVFSGARVCDPQQHVNSRCADLFRVLFEQGSGCGSQTRAPLTGEGRGEEVRPSQDCYIIPVSWSHTKWEQDIEVSLGRGGPAFPRHFVPPLCPRTLVDRATPDPKPRSRRRKPAGDYRNSMSASSPRLLLGLEAFFSRRCRPNI